VLGGWFAQGAFPEVLEALEIVADALQARRGSSCRRPGWRAPPPSA
jgi:hypothetical protein